jgi:hypothetical protein
MPIEIAKLKQLLAARLAARSGSGLRGRVERPLRRSARLVYTLVRLAELFQDMM